MSAPVYKGEALRAVAMPLGGLGTGTIAVAGDGSLRQWQIHNQINHQANVPHSFFALSVDGPQGRTSRVLQSDALYDTHGATPPPTSSDAWVPPAHRDLLSTLPGVKETEFTGPYPFANVSYRDGALPLDVKMTAWNPMIPFNADDSGIPGITFTFTIHNPGTHTYRGTLAATLQNSVGWDGLTDIVGTSCSLYGGNRNENASGGGRTAVRLRNDLLPENAAGNGQLMLSTNGENASLCTNWRSLSEFWNVFEEKGMLPESSDNGTTNKGETTNAAVSVPFLIEPNGTRTISFQLAWNFPNRYVNYIQWPTFGVDDDKSQLWIGNYYSTMFASVDEVSGYLWREHDRLLSATRAFSDTFSNSSLPQGVIDTVTSQMSVMRTPTCFWADDGNFYGFEGCNGYSTLHHAPSYGGSCPLNCTHVWNYEMSLAHLYPTLDTTMRDTEWFLQQHPTGYIPHRVAMPRYVPRIWERDIGGPEKPALDGLLGAILKTWREFRSTGDIAWLEKCWPHVELALDFVKNEHDPEQNGIIENEQPNTYDISIFGLNTFIGTQYIAALYAAARMAERLSNPDRAEALEVIAKSGTAIMEERLWNGEWYFQEVDLNQYAEQNWATGLHSDHLLGQWWADSLQLPTTLDPERIKTSVNSIFKYNYRESLPEEPKPERWFAVPSDKGLINCTWPHEDRPEIPTRYSEEVWTGLEYEVAALLISSGQLDDALTILNAVHSRYDGHRMNPWNNIECGDHYVRAMSSWSILLAATNFGWDAHLGEITLGHRLETNDLVAPFFAAPAWGQFEYGVENGQSTVSLTPAQGNLRIQSIVLPSIANANSAEVTIGGKPVHAEVSLTDRGVCVTLAEAINVDSNNGLRIVALD